MKSFLDLNQSFCMKERLCPAFIMSIDKFEDKFNKKKNSRTFSGIVDKAFEPDITQEVN